MNNIYDYCNEACELDDNLTRVDLSDDDKKRVLEYITKRSSKNGKRTGSKWRGWAIAASILGVMALGSVSVHAFSAHQDILERLFGNSGKDDIEAVVQDTISLPARDFVEIDLEWAESVLGESISTENLQIEVGEHLITIEGFIYDRNGGVMVFTVEKEGGVTMFTNEYPNCNEKFGIGGTGEVLFSVYLNENEPYYIDERGGYVSSHIWLDENRSTDEKWYCCSYMVFDELNDVENPVIYLVYADLPEEVPEDVSEYHFEKYLLTTAKPLDIEQFYNQDGECLELSAIDIKVPNVMSETRDTVISSVTVNYADGTSYTVFDQENQLDNTGHEPLMFETYYKMVFNRLVDTENVISVEVIRTTWANGEMVDSELVEYTPQ